MIRKVFLVTLLGLLAACGGETSTNPAESAKTSKEKIEVLELAGELPKLDRGDSIGGADINGNGVRDDVEAVLIRNYTSPLQLAAAIQTAKALQKSLMVNIADMNSVKAVDREISRGINCIYSKFDGSGTSKQPSQVSSEIEAITSNTKGRLLAYRQFNKALDGTSSALPEGDTCE